MNAVLQAFAETDPARKCERVAALQAADADPAAFIEQPPGRPAKPVLIHPREVPNRGLGSVEGRAALLHAVAHIEFNAINLALDAAARFAGMPPQYYADWISVAQDEARHFGLLTARLAELGYAYGDFAAHNGLWEAAEKTRHDVLVRMALVPRVLEARGLDVTPGIINRFTELRDQASVAVLQVILSEEVRHVAIGSHWYAQLCAGRGIEPKEKFRSLLAEYNMRVRPPLNRSARSEAGFDTVELDALL